MSAKNAKKERRQVIKALGLTYDSVFDDIVKTFNQLPFWKRVSVSWRIMWRKL